MTDEVLMWTLSGCLAFLAILVGGGIYLATRSSTRLPPSKPKIPPPSDQPVTVRRKP